MGVSSFARLIENAYYNHPQTRMSCDTNGLRTQLDTTGSRGRKRSVNSAYGCFEWQPDSVGDGETNETQKQNQLKEEFAKSNVDIQRVNQLMKATYASQRFAINKKTNSAFE